MNLINPVAIRKHAFQNAIACSCSSTKSRSWCCLLGFIQCACFLPKCPKSLQCVCLLLEASQMREHVHLNACHQSVHVSLFVTICPHICLSTKFPLKTRSLHTHLGLVLLSICNWAQDNPDKQNHPGLLQWVYNKTSNCAWTVQDRDIIYYNRPLYKETFQGPK